MTCFGRNYARYTGGRGDKMPADGDTSKQGETQGLFALQGGSDGRFAICCGTSQKLGRKVLFHDELDWLDLVTMLSKLLTGCSFWCKLNK